MSEFEKGNQEIKQHPIFSEQDFNIESGVEYGLNEIDDGLAYLNNFYLRFPGIRENVYNMNLDRDNPEYSAEMQKLFDDLDEGLKEHGIDINQINDLYQERMKLMTNNQSDESNKALQVNKDKMYSVLKQTYIILRNKGYGRERLTK